MCACWLVSRRLWLTYIFPGHPGMACFSQVKLMWPNSTEQNNYRYSVVARTCTGEIRGLTSDGAYLWARYSLPSRCLPCSSRSRVLWKLLCCFSWRGLSHHLVAFSCRFATLRSRSILCGHVHRLFSSFVRFQCSSRSSCVIAFCVVSFIVWFRSMCSLAPRVVSLHVGSRSSFGLVTFLMHSRSWRGFILSFNQAASVDLVAGQLS